MRREVKRPRNAVGFGHALSVKVRAKVLPTRAEALSFVLSLCTCIAPVTFHRTRNMVALAII